MSDKTLKYFDSTVVVKHGFWSFENGSVTTISEILVSVAFKSQYDEIKQRKSWNQFKQKNLLLDLSGCIGKRPIIAKILRFSQ